MKNSDFIKQKWRILGLVPKAFLANHECPLSPKRHATTRLAKKRAQLACKAHLFLVVFINAFRITKIILIHAARTAVSTENIQVTINQTFDRLSHMINFWSEAFSIFLATEKNFVELT